MVLTKQSVGIDIAKLSFTACICKRSLDCDRELIFSQVRKFANNKTGFNQLMKWVSKNTDKKIPVSFAM